jgi:acyl phosphate:glycerol-3-phosphate acyltransferase
MPAASHILQSALLIAGAYLLGSIPTAYLAGRWLKGMDIRRYGSGTVSGSTVFEQVARWAVVPVGLFDIGKAALPTWLGQQLGLGLPVAAAAGMAAAIGHNWPIFLRFTGGRGIGCFIGILLVIFPWGFPWILGFMAVGRLMGSSAEWALASVALLPLFAYALGRPPVVVYTGVAMLVVTIAKRLEANRRPLPPPGPERRRVLLRRLIWDRDIASHQEWLDRKPGS